jgi:hypothetical protein
MPETIEIEAGRCYEFAGEYADQRGIFRAGPVRGEGRNGVLKREWTALTGKHAGKRYEISDNDLPAFTPCRKQEGKKQDETSRPITDQTADQVEP